MKEKLKNVSTVLVVGRELRRQGGRAVDVSPI